jgi:hypothetical protein
VILDDARDSDRVRRTAQRLTTFQMLAELGINWRVVAASSPLAMTSGLAPGVTNRVLVVAH